MREKEVGVLIIKAFILVVIVITPFVYAAPNAEVNLTPIDIYETNEKFFNLTINNLFGNEPIKEIRVSMPGFEITNAVDFLGWDNTFSDSSIRWYNGNIETNIFGALFLYNAKADFVTNDTTSAVEITTEGDALEETTYTISVEIKNDNTGPLLSNSIPEDGSFLRTNMIDQEISIHAEDPETGINTARFDYWNCNDINNTDYIVLNCQNNTCSNQLDLLDYEEGDLMCFEFIVHNYALESSSLTGSVGFDGTPPSVTLIAPENNEYGSTNTIFSFNATDNLAPELTCSLIIDDEVIDSVAANNGELTTTTYNMENVSEGNYLWKITCTDFVGLSADSETRNIIIDKTPPEITLNSPENNSTIGDNVIIDIDVIDNYGLYAVNYSDSLNSSELPEGTNIITVTAVDWAGNTAETEFTFIVDKTPPEIAIITPPDNTSSDVHVNLVFDIFDNLDNELDCTIFANDNPETTQLLDTAQIANIILILPMDNYEWYIQCQDNAQNSVTTIPRNLNVTDLTGPDIISDIIYVARTEDYLFDATITDISGIDNVNIIFDSSSLTTTNNGDTYSGTIQTNINHSLEEYTLTITADDTLANSNTLYDRFTLIQGYIINLQLTPSPAEPGQQIIVSGTAVLDDNGQVPEDSITLELPDQTVDTSIDNGTFEYTFDAPDQEGEYTITATIISSEGFEHQASSILQVELPIVASGQGSSHNPGPSGTTIYCGDNLCQTFEDCEDCPQDCGECPPEPVVEEEPVQEPITEEPVEEEPQQELPSAEPRTPAGIGGASSWFKDIAFNPWSWTAVLTIITGLYTLSFVKTRPIKPKLNWDNYFEKRR
ncbi:hypothetical protein KY342_01320 [Candidatus Woesearchaeota archaeon]|nr:hypothetical protein [Candidatus Woesearchaeota archaeon]